MRVSERLYGAKLTSRVKLQQYFFSICYYKRIKYAFAGYEPYFPASLTFLEIKASMSVRNKLVSLAERYNETDKPLV